MFLVQGPLAVLALKTFSISKLKKVLHIRQRICKTFFNLVPRHVRSRSMIESSGADVRALYRTCYTISERMHYRLKGALSLRQGTCRELSMKKVRHSTPA